MNVESAINTRHVIIVFLCHLNQWACRAAAVRLMDHITGKKALYLRAWANCLLNARHTQPKHTEPARCAALPTQSERVCVFAWLCAQPFWLLPRIHEKRGHKSQCQGLKKEKKEGWGVQVLLQDEWNISLCIVDWLPFRLLKCSAEMLTCAANRARCGSRLRRRSLPDSYTSLDTLRHDI